MTMSLAALDQTSRRRPLRHRRSASRSRIGLVATVRLWIRRSQTRRCLVRLLDGNDYLSNNHLLRDIGATSDEAWREVGKWFWQR